ncbi:hypothetical protein HY480_03250 [Candidatus Uhrbacteria bacterium]|nr:hypothetical protein [Candidatus Uhrbacteria bacterium]
MQPTTEKGVAEKGVVAPSGAGGAAPTAAGNHHPADGFDDGGPLKVTFENARAWVHAQFDLVERQGAGALAGPLVERIIRDLTELEDMVAMSAVAMELRKDVERLFADRIGSSSASDVVRRVCALASGELHAAPVADHSAAVPAAQPRTRRVKRRRTRTDAKSAPTSAPATPLSSHEQTQNNDAIRIRMLRAEAKGAKAVKVETRAIMKEANLSHHGLERLMRRAHGAFQRDFAVRVLRNTPMEIEARVVFASELAELCPSAGNAKALLAASRKKQ